jgi:hypothetical protein
MAGVNGEAVVILSPLEQESTALPLLRGFGAPVEKSAASLSLSVHPAAARNAAVVFVRVAVGPVPSKQLVPVP